MEFVAAVAWQAELFPDAHQREKVLGYTQAFSSIGGLLVAVANGLCIVYATSLPAIHLPEWLNFFGGEIGDARAPWRYTLMSGIIPAIPLILIRAFLPESPAWKERQAAGIFLLLGVVEFGKYGWTGIAVTLVGGAVVGWLTWLISIGISKVLPSTNRALISFFQIPGLILMSLVFGMFAMKDIDMLKMGMFVVALCTIAQFSFWGTTCR